MTGSTITVFMTQSTITVFIHSKYHYHFYDWKYRYRFHDSKYHYIFHTLEIPLPFHDSKYHYRFHKSEVPQPFRKISVNRLILFQINPLKPELNQICYLLALLGAHHFLRFSRIRVKLLTFRLLMSYIYMEHPFLMFLDHTQRRSTVGRTPLDE